MTEAARAAGLLAALLLLTGAKAAPPAERIVYETRQVFCVSCEAQTLTVDADGSVTLETRVRTDPYHWQRSSRSWRVAPEKYAAFRAVLQPYRPEGARVVRDGECELYITHYGAIVINWRGGGRDASLDYDLGCSGEQVYAMRAAIERAPAALGMQRRPGSDVWEAGG